jgi:hypothetical protein
MAGTYGSPVGAGTEPSGWAIGWMAFAATMMLIQGTWWAIAGLVALFNDEFFIVGQEYIFRFDVTAWGWIHLSVGLLVFLAGIARLLGAVWARAVGVIMATIAMIAAFAWLPWYPLWAILFVAVSIGVIWALTVHGRDVAGM